MEVTSIDLRKQIISNNSKNQNIKFKGHYRLFVPIIEEVALTNFVVKKISKGGFVQKKELNVFPRNWMHFDLNKVFLLVKPKSFEILPLEKNFQAQKVCIVQNYHLNNNKYPNDMGLKESMPIDIFTKDNVDRFLQDLNRHEIPPVLENTINPKDSYLINSDSAISKINKVSSLHIVSNWINSLLINKLGVDDKDLKAILEFSPKLPPKP